MGVNQKNLSNEFNITTIADSSIKKLETLGMNINELVKLVQDKVGYSPVMMNWIMSSIIKLQWLPAWLQWGFIGLTRNVLDKTFDYTELSKRAAVEAFPSNNKS